MKLEKNFTLHHLITHTYICYFTVIRINFYVNMICFPVMPQLCKYRVMDVPGVGGVSKKIGGSVLVPVWRHVSLQSQWIPISIPSKFASRIKRNYSTVSFLPSEELATKQFSKMPASVTPQDDNSKTTTVIIYLEGLSSKQQFISRLRQIKTTTQSALARNTLSQKPRKAKP